MNRWIAGLAVSLLGLSAQAQENVEAGKKLFARCTSCHAPPDRSLRADQIWLEMVPESA